MAAQNQCYYSAGSSRDNNLIQPVGQHHHYDFLSYYQRTYGRNEPLEYATYSEYPTYQPQQCTPMTIPHTYAVDKTRKVPDMWYDNNPEKPTEFTSEHSILKSRLEAPTTSRVMNSENFFEHLANLPQSEGNYNLPELQPNESETDALEVTPPDGVFPWMTSRHRTRPEKSRRRQTYTHQQKLYLEAEFHNSIYISKKKRMEIADTLGLSDRQVKTWFQNRRIKSKKSVTQTITQDQGDVKPNIVEPSQQLQQFHGTQLL